MLTNWSRYPRPSEIDEETRRDLARIEHAILGGDVGVLDEYGGLHAALKRANVLGEARAQACGPWADGTRRHMDDGSAGVGSILLGDLMSGAVPDVCKRQWGSMHILGLW